ncbi:antitoxin [bacterium]|nr:antitoxin [bacterium]
MRTTVTLDPDVLQMLQTTMKERGISFKEALNVAVREALGGGNRRRARAFKVEAVSMGTPTLDLTKSLALAADLEDEEIVRKLSMRK